MTKKSLSKKENKKQNQKTERVYLDFASQTTPSKKAISEMKKAEKFNFNPNNIYKEGLDSERFLNEARTRIARVLGVKSHEIYFTNNATLSCATAIFGVVEYFRTHPQLLPNLLRRGVKPHIITSNIEHSAVLENIKYLEKRGEIEVSYIESDENGIIDAEKVEKEIKENTVLISIMYVNNEIGTIQDIKAISKKIKDWKKTNKREIFSYPYFHTDASQAGNYLSLYIDRLGVDLLSLNGSKIYGPKSSGILFKREKINLAPFYFGGGQERNIFSGTVDVEKSVGISIAIEEAQKKVNNLKILENVATKRNNLLKNILKNIPEAKLIGSWNENEWKVEKKGVGREERVAKRLPSNISIWLPDFLSDEMVLRLDEKGFAVSAGSACSAKSDEYSHVIFNISKNKNNKSKSQKVARETIRISIDESIKEVDLERFAKVLKEIYFKFKK
ncbi:MAG: Cysteine desulfurase [Patescibacteria group bacterium]|nr:Cysteine desulfurase [Patescibacteria group bacterium]